MKCYSFLFVLALFCVNTFAEEAIDIEGVLETVEVTPERSDPKTCLVECMKEAVDCITSETPECVKKQLFCIKKCKMNQDPLKDTKCPFLKCLYGCKSLTGKNRKKCLLKCKAMIPKKPSKCPFVNCARNCSRTFVDCLVDAKSQISSYKCWIQLRFCSVKCKHHHQVANSECPKWAQPRGYDAIQKPQHIKCPFLRCIVGCKSQKGRKRKSCLLKCKAMIPKKPSKCPFINCARVCSRNLIDCLLKAKSKRSAIACFKRTYYCVQKCKQGQVKSDECPKWAQPRGKGQSPEKKGWESYEQRGNEYFGGW